MTDLPERWLLATSEWVRFTFPSGDPVAVNPRLVTFVDPGPSGTTIHMAGEDYVDVTEDFATVMDRLSGKRRP